VNESRNSMEP